MIEEVPINPAFKDPIIKTVEVATLADVEGIIAVQDSRVCDRGALVENNDRIEESGVLIYRTNEEELRDLIADSENHFLFVLKEGEEVIGFALCYSLENWVSTKPEWRENLILEQGAPDIFSQPTLYFRQIAVLPGKEGSGQGLELRVFREAKSRGYKFVVGDILKSPIENKRSMTIHKHRGFVPIGIVNDKDLVWTLVCREM